MKLLTLTALLACALVLPVHAAPGGTAKSIVLSTLEGRGTGMDGMQISFLVRNKDGSMKPRDHKHPFNANHRFKVEVISTSDGLLTVTNIDPSGRVHPLLTQAVTTGAATIVPARKDQFFEFDGPKGEERLRFEVTPTSYMPPVEEQPGGVNAQNSPNANASAKSIQLVTTSDGNSDFVARPTGTGLLAQEIIIKRK